MFSGVTACGESKAPTLIPVTPGSGAMTMSALPASAFVSRSSQSPG